MVKIFLFILFFVVFFITTLYENYWREKEAEARKLKVKALADIYGNRWHWFQWFNWAFTFIYIILFALELDIYLTGVIVLLIASIWWILYDGLLNRLRGEKFFHRSEFSTSEFEHYAYPKTKIVFLIISIILLVIVL